MPIVGKEYLGDGVYIAVEDGQLLLTTENGIAVTNSIYIDNTLLKRLNQFASKVYEQGGD